MEKKSNKGLIITIIILVLLLIGVSGYLVYDKFLSNDGKVDSSEKSEKKENNSGNKVVSKEEQDKILKVINDINNYNLARYDNLNPSEIHNQDKLAFMSFVVYNNQLNGEDGSIAGLSGMEVNSIYQSYFGSKQSIMNKDIYINDYIEYGVGENNEVLFRYDNTKNIYQAEKMIWLAPPGYEISTTYNFIVNATKKDDIYTVEVQSFYTTPCSGVCAPDSIIAGSYKDASGRTNSIVDLVNAAEWRDNDGNIIQSNLDTDYNKVKDKLPVYTYTFVLENGNYVLQSKTMKDK